MVSGITLASVELFLIDVSWYGYWLSGACCQGLLFKVNGVSSTSPTYGALAVIMLLLCIAFVLSWLFVAASSFVGNAMARKRGRMVDQDADAVTGTTKSLVFSSDTPGDDTDVAQRPGKAARNRPGG